jgi:chemotaxis signal transduction protein
LESNPSTTSQAGPNGKIELRIFRSSSVGYAILASDVEEVTEWRTPTPLPNSRAPIVGIVSVQARMITVIDSAKLLVDGPSSHSNHPRMIVVVTGDEQLGLTADLEKNSIEISSQLIEIASRLEGNLFRGYVNLNGEDVNIINPANLFAAAIRGRERRRRQF